VQVADLPAPIHPQDGAATGVPRLGRFETMARHSQTARAARVTLGTMAAIAAIAALVATAALAAGMAGRQGAAQGPPDHHAGHPGHDMSAMGMDHAGAADESMAHEHMGMGPHMKMTAPRPRTAEDQRRADAILQALRPVVSRYRDYRAAVADGYIQYLPNLPQPMYHFTNWGNAYLAEFSFDPTHPTSLLYKPVAGGFELAGAMYTAPQRFAEDQLDQRVPLGVAAWHQHVNICLPEKARYATADWRRFGFGGTIATAAECETSGGTFHPVIFGWMVHVYPFEQDPAKVWAH
jgi:hypothetical protein